MKVNLIRSTTDPIDAIASAFAITRGLTYSEYLITYPTIDKKKKLIVDCYESGHMSGFEFVDIDFEIIGCSRVFEVDKVRSRLSSYEVEAGMFSEKRDFETVVPFEYTQEEADERIEVIRGWNRKDKERGIDPRKRRYWTHQGLSRRMRSKQNLRSLIETSWLRMCTTTQWEYRLFMDLAKIEVSYNIDPFFAQFLDAKCVKLGYCPEIWSPCGRFPTKKLFMEAYSIGLSQIELDSK